MNNRKDLDSRLGVAQQQCVDGLFKEAETELLEVIRDFPGAGGAYRLLARVEQRLGKTGHMKLALEQLSALEPENADVWCDLGDINYALNDWDLATDAYQRALDLIPTDRRYLARLAYGQLSAQLFNKIETTRRQLLRDHADFSISHIVDGHVYKSQGNLEQAAESYARAIQVDPGQCEAIFHLVELKTPGPGDPFTARIVKLIENGEILDDEKAHLYFSLSRIYENAKQFDLAFDHYQSANQHLQQSMKKKGLEYDPPDAEARISGIISAYSIDAFKRPIKPLEINLTPIFIVGMPRSGTSLIEQILGSHPDVSAGGEMTIAQMCMRQYLIKRNALNLGETVKWGEQAESDLLMEIREKYVEYLFDHEMDSDYVTDKLPGNFKILGFIRNLFPNAIIIHCRRNPLATCWSLYAAHFGEHDPYYTSLKHLAHYYKQYLRLMEHWSAVLQPGMIEIEYEAFVLSPEEGTRQLLDQCGLPWDAACLDFQSNPRQVVTASYGQIRQTVYTSSIDKWRKYEQHLNDLKTLAN